MGKRTSDNAATTASTASASSNLRRLSSNFGARTFNVSSSGLDAEDSEMSESLRGLTSATFFMILSDVARMNKLPRRETISLLCFRS